MVVLGCMNVLTLVKFTQPGFHSLISNHSCFLSLSLYLPFLPFPLSRYLKNPPSSLHSPRFHPGKEGLQAAICEVQHAREQTDWFSRIKERSLEIDAEVAKEFVTLRPGKTTQRKFSLRRRRHHHFRGNGDDWADGSRGRHHLHLSNVPILDLDMGFLWLLVVSNPPTRMPISNQPRENSAEGTIQSQATDA